jgi:hypothetical protein
VNNGKIDNLCVTLHTYDFCGENIRLIFSHFQEYNSLLLTKITILYNGSLELIPSN